MRRNAVCIAAVILCGCMLASVPRLSSRDSVRYVLPSLGAYGTAGTDRAPESRGPEATTDGRQPTGDALQRQAGTEVAAQVPAGGGGGAAGGRAPEAGGPKAPEATRSKEEAGQQPGAEVAGPVPAGGGGVAAGGLARGPDGPEVLDSKRWTADELREQPERMRFFIHEELMAPRAELMRCWLHELLGVHETMIDVDEKVGVGMAEHFHEWDLLSRFREHPQRTFDVESAHLHVVFLFQTAPDQKIKQCKNRSGSGNHSLQYLLEQMRLLPAFQRREKFAISHPSFNKPPMWVRDAFFDSRHVMVLEDDFWFGAPLVKCLQVPYVAHRQLDAVARGSTSSLQEVQVRHITFMFHGKGYRNAEGRNRGILMNMIRGNFSDTSLVDYSFERDKDQAAQFRHIRETAQIYLRSQFCLILPGDTHTTRRMYDAMAAGCIPVVYGNVLLPFSESVPWTELVIFLDSCNANVVIQRLRELLLRSDVAERGKAVQAAYARWLSFTQGTGMVSAILREEVEVMSAFGDRATHFSKVKKQCGPDSLF